MHFYRDDLELRLHVFGGVRPYLQISFLSFIRNNLRRNIWIFSRRTRPLVNNNSKRSPVVMF